MEFFYGLSLFGSGILLATTTDWTPSAGVKRAILALSAFGIFHSVYIWVGLFQSAIAPVETGAIIWLVALFLSCLGLLLFGAVLLPDKNNQKKYMPVIVLAAVCLAAFLSMGATGVTTWPAAAELAAHVCLLIPGALLGAWALVSRQRLYRQQNISTLGRDFMWSAVALCLYGAIALFNLVSTTSGPLSVLLQTVIWLGFIFFLLRALQALKVEHRRLEKTRIDTLTGQIEALKAENKAGKEMEKLNDELRLTARELMLVLDLSNLLAEPMSLQERLQRVLETIVTSLNFSSAGMILLTNREIDQLQVRVASGFAGPNETDEQYAQAFELGTLCVTQKLAMCRHLDDRIIEFIMEDALHKQECRRHQSPTIMISLPLAVQRQVIGSLVLTQANGSPPGLPFEEFKLILGISQQLGLSIENARLYRDVKKREKQLAELLHQVVGAQEAERQRIARELHDATGQSLTAIALGLGGVENMLAGTSPEVATQVKALKDFGTDALGELRDIITDLRPSQLDDLGLVSALKWYAQEFQKRYNIPVDFVVEGDPLRLPSEYETVLFRITQEALSNVVKHAQATYVAVTIEMYSAQICVMIEDDGRGFDVNKVFGRENNQAGWGLLGIRERTLLLGGQYEFDSAPGRGTFIRVSVPLVMEMNYAKDSAITG